MRRGWRAEWPRGRVGATEISLKEICFLSPIGLACDPRAGKPLRVWQSPGIPSQVPQLTSCYTCLETQRGRARGFSALTELTESFSEHSLLMGVHATLFCGGYLAVGFTCMAYPKNPAPHGSAVSAVPAPHAPSSGESSGRDSRRSQSN